MPLGAHLEQPGRRGARRYVQDFVLPFQLELREGGASGGRRLGFVAVGVVFGRPAGGGGGGLRR